MKKRSHKQPALSERDDAGCLSGLINIFDLRIGHHSQKLLTDRRRGIGRHLGADLSSAGTGYSRSKLGLPSNSEIKHADADDVHDGGAKGVNLGMASVKTLMEEEMSRKHTPKIPNDELEKVRSDLGSKIHLKRNHKKKCKNHNAVSELYVNDSRVSANLDLGQTTTQQSSFNLDWAAFMVEFSCDNHRYQEKQADSKIDSCPPLEYIGHRKHNHLDEPDSQLSKKHSIHQKALGDVAEVFLSQKLVDAKKLTTNGTVQSKEFVDALEILRSNKELCLKLIQDPNSLLLKHIQDLQNSQVGSELLGEEVGTSEKHEKSVSNELFHKQNRHNLFRRKDKSKGTKSSKGSGSSQAVNKIVVLKPSQARIQNAPSPSSSPRLHHILKLEEDGERNVSSFSLKEIKRRLWHVIGKSRKVRHSVSMDGVLHRIPYGFKDSGDMGKNITRENFGTKTSCNAEHTSQPSAIAKKRDKKSKPKEIAHLAHRKSFFYEEAEKHLTESLAARDKTDSLPTKEVSKTLGRIVSLPQDSPLSPRFSPRRDKEVDLSRFSPSQQLENPTNRLSPLRQILESSTPYTGSNLCDKTQVIYSNPECIEEDLKPKGSMKTVVISEIISLEECKDLDVLSETIGNEPNIICERCNEEECSTLIEPGTSDEKLQLVMPSVSISPSFLLIKNLEDPKGTLDKPERPSPVSVLEPLFSEDVLSPGSTTTDHADLPLQHQQIYSEEHDSSAVVLTSSYSEANPRICLDEKEAMFDFITTLLEASGLSCDGTSERWHSSDQLLDPSLFDEVGISHSPLPDDPYLIFDCLNEVLVEIQERLFGCTPWFSLIKPNARPILRGGNFIREVYRGIERHLLQSQFPRTLDQIVRKDMEGGTWMDIRFETEDIVIKMADAIFEEIMQEIVFELWV